MNFRLDGRKDGGSDNSAVGDTYAEGRYAYRRILKRPKISSFKVTPVMILS